MIQKINIVLARKPLSEKSVVENVLKWGTGGLNIDGSRITIKDGDKTSAGHRTCNIFDEVKIPGGNGSPDYEQHELGRFPANIIFDEEAGEVLDKQSGPTSQGHWSKTKTKGYGNFGNGESTYQGVGHKDKNKGGASRFFKQIKKD